MGYKNSIVDRMSQEPGDVLKEKRGGANQKKIHKEVMKSLEILEEYQKDREEWATKFFEDQ